MIGLENQAAVLNELQTAHEERDLTTTVPNGFGKPFARPPPPQFANLRRTFAFAGPVLTLALRDRHEGFTTVCDRPSDCSRQGFVTFSQILECVHCCALDTGAHLGNVVHLKRSLLCDLGELNEANKAPDLDVTMSLYQWNK